MVNPLQMNKCQIPDKHQKRLNLISRYISEFRKCEGLTQKEVSLELNLHQNTIVRMENGHNITLVSLFELSDFYGMSLGEFLDDIE